MKCLLQFKWVKLPRAHLPAGKGIMAHWAKLAARAAFRKGNATYCGYTNEVDPGMWSGGIVGLKSILGIKNREKVLEILNALSELGYIQYSLDKKTKKLSYQISDWVIKCSGAECMDGSVYATDGYGFLCLPRNITERLVINNRIFGEADAWLDLWCHTAHLDYSNAFSFLAPVIQYGRYGAVLTLETLGQRWGWEKTKVWRFFKKHGDAFALYRLPGNYGCLIFNKLYPTCTEVSMPEYEQVVCILNEIRIMAKNAHKYGTENQRINRMIAWNSKRLIQKHNEQASVETDEAPENRVALFRSIIRAYFSRCRNCKSCRNCIYDCVGVYIGRPSILQLSNQIRGPCRAGPNDPIKLLWRMTK